MFDHVDIRASDRPASERFYDVVLSVVGLEKSHSDEHLAEWGDFSLVQATSDRPVTKRLHIAFFVPSHGVVDEFWGVFMDERAHRLVRKEHEDVVDGGARALAGIGVSLLSSGPADAAGYLRRALAIYERIGSPDAQSVRDTLKQHGL